MIPVSQPCLHAEETKYVCQALAMGRLSQGKFVAQFEEAFAAYLNVKHVVAVSSGTAALHLALVAHGIGAGDVVVVPDVTFVATANAVRYTGASVELVDVDPIDGCISASEVRRSVDARAILPVHLYGVPAQMKDLQAAAPSLIMIEDAAEGLGGYYALRPLGTYARCGAFSFYGNKVLAMGEGGALVTNDDALAVEVRSLRTHAHDSLRRYFHSKVAFNYRLTDLQAAVGLGQLEHLDEMLEWRRAVVQTYRSRLGGHTVRGQAPWLFTMQFASKELRDHVADYLLLHEVETRPVFIPLHRLPMYAMPDRCYSNAVSFSERGLSLPTHPDLARADVDRICDLVEGAVERWSI